MNTAERADKKTVRLLLSFVHRITEAENKVYNFSEHHQIFISLNWSAAATGYTTGIYRYLSGVIDFN